MSLSDIRREALIKEASKLDAAKGFFGKFVDTLKGGRLAEARKARDVAAKAQSKAHFQKALVDDATKWETGGGSVVRGSDLASKKRATDHMNLVGTSDDIVKHNDKVRAAADKEVRKQMLQTYGARAGAGAALAGAGLVGAKGVRRMMGARAATKRRKNLGRAVGLLGATGLAQCSELTWQLRGEADRRQVDGVTAALQHNIGLGGAAVVTAYQRAER